MAQFDVHRLKSGELVLDCQSNFLKALDTRLVVPLVDPTTVPEPLPRLHPLFEVEGDMLLLATHWAGAIPLRDIGPRVASPARHDFIIGNALDFLLTGV